MKTYNLEEEFLRMKVGDNFLRETAEIRHRNALLEMKLKEAVEELQQN